MKKLLLTSIAVLFLATPASAQSALRNVVDANQTCVWVGSPGTFICLPHSPKQPMARVKTIRKQQKR
jgi:hypothetical protein